MIKGLGIDLVRVDRIEGIIEKWGERFLNKIYSSAEREYCYSKARPALHLAARFAVKEAVIKMLGGNSYNLCWHDFEVKNNQEGLPELKTSASLQELLKKKGIERVHISISHEQEYAIAQVIGEGD